MKGKNKVLKPNVIRGGVAVPLGSNKYLMKGRKHKSGGIDIGKNPKTGIEVEGDEVIHLTNKEAKVFSAEPILNGESPANKILKGESVNKVIKQQEDYKRRNNLNDDGTKKGKRGMAQKGIRKKTDVPSTGLGSKKKRLTDKSYLTTVASRGSLVKPVVSKKNTINTNYNITKRKKKDKNNVKLQDITTSDIIGQGANIVGSIVSHGLNRKTLNKMKAPSRPVSKKAVKLKTKININPQLDNMRETVESYTRDVNKNTSNSRTALARVSKARFKTMLNKNELYGRKENAETSLINKDRQNQQTVANSNTDSYNRWQDSVANHKNKILDAKGENDISLISNVNSSIQKGLSDREGRRQFRENLKLVAATHPNVSKEYLKSLGVDVVDLLPDSKRKKSKNKIK